MGSILYGLHGGFNRLIACYEKKGNVSSLGYEVAEHSDTAEVPHYEVRDRQIEDNQIELMGHKLLCSIFSAISSDHRVPEVVKETPSGFPEWSHYRQ